MGTLLKVVKPGTLLKNVADPWVKLFEHLNDLSTDFTHLGLKEVTSTFRAI